MKGQRAFTLIELLVVIDIISLLSGIVLVSLKGARARARDSVRLSDMNQIRKVLELYRAINDQYPVRTCPCGDGGWETSDAGTPDDFMEYLVPHIETPVDPVNQRDVGWSFFGPRAGSYFYSYHRYTTPYGPCPEIESPFAVLGFCSVETINVENLPHAFCGDPGPDGICTVEEYHAGQCRDWRQEFDYSLMLTE